MRNGKGTVINEVHEIKKKATVELTRSRIHCRMILFWIDRSKSVCHKFVCMFPGGHLSMEIVNHRICVRLFCLFARENGNDPTPRLPNGFHEVEGASQPLGIH